MKLFDKLKDLFTDDVQEDEEVLLEDDNKELYQEPKDVLPKVMRDDIEEEKKTVNKKEIFNFEEVEGIREEKKIEIKNNIEEAPSRKFNFQNEYAEEVSSRNSRNVIKEEVKKEEFTTSIKPLNLRSVDEAPKKIAELYTKKDDSNIKPKFRATPVISPVYGVLDKNYKKDEVKEKNEDRIDMKRPSKKVDFETVRKKAFGNLVDEIKDINLCENCELYKEVKRINALTEDDLLYEMTVDDEDNKDVTIEKAYDNYEEFGVAYEPKIVHTDVNPTEIIVTSEEKKDTITIKSSNVDDDLDVPQHEDVVPSRSEKIENIKEEKVDNNNDSKKNIADADFFELIDSMYKERSDE